ncbi:SRPBCC family protein [Jiella sonneratiae]|uniref:SRPBCC family protein n=1 Tax=Jiella sonneratiae TaxID=2816856 RepID=A0ABS3J5X1_9HYPH|nr:SRPBCC family protein [Jiella sonneratiae]MBO0904540.1 SRPBCC family protein [Jiella sonneratiae]
MDRIEQTIDLAAPLDRVWQALTDHEAFGAWFRVALDGPFVLGEVSRGRITYPGYEHVQWRATVVAMEKPGLFAFTWHPYAIDPAVDYSGETPTRVEFRLQPIDTGTRLTLTESGFEGVAPGRMPEAFRMNQRGWEMQMQNIRAHVES